MTEEQKICFLKDEYLKLQDGSEDFDRRSLTIKGWISAGAIAAIAIGLDPGKTGGESIWLVVMISAACFWYLEAKWKLFQYALSDRIRMIEAHFRGDQDILIKELYPFQIYNWWSKTHQYDMPIYPYEGDFRPKDYWKRFRIGQLFRNSSCFRIY